MYKLGYNKSF